MDQEVKAKWLEALESGKYKPGQQALRKIDAEGVERFCCLGVLGDLLNPDLWNGPSPVRDEAGELTGEEYYDLQERTGFLPREAYDWAGIDLDAQHELAELNDLQDPPSYDEVTRYIRDNL